MRAVFYTYPDHFGSNVVTLDRPMKGIEGEIALHIDEYDLKYDTYAVDLLLETGETEVAKINAPYKLTTTDEYLTIVGPFRNEFSAVTWARYIRKKMLEWGEAYDEGNDADSGEGDIPRPHEEDI